MAARPLAALSCALLALLGGCSTPAPDSVCLATRPIWLGEPAIRALAPFRAEREAIAAHNRTWTALCQR